MIEEHLIAESSHGDDTGHGIGDSTGDDTEDTPNPDFSNADLDARMNPIPDPALSFLQRAKNIVSQNLASQSLNLRLWERSKLIKVIAGAVIVIVGLGYFAKRQYGPDKAKDDVIPAISNEEATDPFVYPSPEAEIEVPAIPVAPPAAEVVPVPEPKQAVSQPQPNKAAVSKEVSKIKRRHKGAKVKKKQSVLRKAKKARKAKTKRY